MSIIEKVPFKFTSDKDEEEYKLITQLLFEMATEWSVFNTRAGSRRVESINPLRISDNYSFLTGIINKMIALAKTTINDGSMIIPFQLYLCYYRSGSDACPMHKHACRQLTLSFGASRTMTVDNDKVVLENGYAIYIHGKKHGIPRNTETGERVSFNLFFTTTSERQGTDG